MIEDKHMTLQHNAVTETVASSCKN